MSLPVGLVAYRHFLRIDYFQTLHLAVGFIVLGIGCDDVFVFHDFWVCSFQHKALRNEPILRLSWAWRKAASAMLVTSLTSAITFASCTISGVPPIASFGWFAALVVPAVFLQTILMLPTIYFYYEKYLMHWSSPWGCCFKKAKVSISPYDKANH